MDNIKKLIESIVEEEIDEVAIGSEEAQKSEIALHVFDSLSVKEYYLYSFDGEIKIYAMLRTKKSVNCIGFREVSLAAAEKGFGPLIYEIGMTNDFLMPTTDSISTQAKNVWVKFFNRDDIEKRITGCNQNKEDFMKFAYKIKSPPNVSGLINNHNRNLSRVALYNKTKSNFLDEIEQEGKLFFSRKYTG